MAADLEDIAFFTKVVKAGSFSAAARGAGLSPSAISKRMARLEVSLGVSLLSRTTRKIALTEAGQHFYETCARSLGEIDAAKEVVARVQGHTSWSYSSTCAASLRPKVRDAIHPGLPGSPPRCAARHPLRATRWGPYG